MLQRWFRRGIWNFHIVFSNQFEIQIALPANGDERKRREKRPVCDERTAWIIARIGPRRAIRPCSPSAASIGPSVSERECGTAKSLKIGRFLVECAARSAAAADQTPGRCARGNDTHAAPAQTLSGRYSTPCARCKQVGRPALPAGPTRFCALPTAAADRPCCAIAHVQRHFASHVRPRIGSDYVLQAQASGHVSLFSGRGCMRLQRYRLQRNQCKGAAAAGAGRDIRTGAIDMRMHRAAMQRELPCQHTACSAQLASSRYKQSQ